MNRYLYIATSLIMSIGTTSAVAQTQPNDTTLNRVMVIENEYTPTINDAVKINTMPAVEAPVVVKKQVEYAISAMPSIAIPTSTMQPFIGIEKPSNPKKGYVRVGAGNYGNVDALANYLLILSPKDKIDFFFNIEGRKGKLEVPGLDTEKWKSHYYRTRASIQYAHQFDRVVMNIGGQFGLSNFNFIPNEWSHLQKFTSGDVRLAAKSTSEDLPLQFDAETNFMIYQRKMNLFNNGAMDEYRIKTRANAWGQISEGQSVGVAIAMNNMLYSGAGLHDYTTIDFNPYYKIDNDYWRVNIGANIDIAAGYGKAFRVSPNITAEYVITDKCVTYIKATGGRLLNDFRRLEVYNPYGLLLQQEANTYEQINASIGARIGTQVGLWFHIYGGYQDLKDELYCDNAADLTPANIEASSRLPIIYATENMSNAYVGANITYSYKQYVNLSAAATYRHWNADINDWALLMKPKFEMNFNADFSPIDHLLINVGYQYIRRPKVGVDHFKVNAVNNLYLGASYEFYKGLSAYTRINNLLNQKYDWYFNYPTEKFNFLVGLSYKF